MKTGKTDLQTKLKKIKQRLAQELPSRRYTHTMGVMYTAAALAMRHDVSLMEQAMLAGLLHDCAKGMSQEAQYGLCRKHGIVLSEAEKQNGSLIHAKLGVWMAKEEYGIEEESILQAIRFHTTGRPQMTVLEQIVYIADFIEPNREKMYSVLPKARTLAFENLDHATAYIAEAVLGYLQSRNQPIDELTNDTFQWYLKSGR